MMTDAPITSVAHDFDRRWCADDYFDLIVWYEPDQQIHGFQLCYDKPGRERALTWTRDEGFLHTTVDSGESRPTANRTPFLAADNEFPGQLVASEFATRGASLQMEIRDLVTARIEEYRRLRDA